MSPVWWTLLMVVFWFSWLVFSVFLFFWFRVSNYLSNSFFFFFFIMN